MMAQFSKEVSDDDGEGDQAGDGRGAEEGVGEDGEGDGGPPVGDSWLDRGPPSTGDPHDPHVSQSPTSQAALLSSPSSALLFGSNDEYLGGSDCSRKPPHPMACVGVAAKTRHVMACNNGTGHE